MAHHKIGDVGEGQLGSWGFPEGGMGAVSRALRDAAIANGATVRTDAPVARIDVRNGRVRGVTLESGEELRADVVVAATHPKITFLEHIDRAAAPDRFRRAHRTLAIPQRHGEGQRRGRPAPGVHRASPASIPRCTAARSCSPSRSTTSRARSRTRSRAGPRRFRSPTSASPVVFDPTLAPEGKHVVSMFTQWVPHTYASRRRTKPSSTRTPIGSSRASSDVAPGFTSSILHRQVIGPYEMEHEYGLIGGNIFHGELSPDQMFHMRPAPGYADFRTPIAGLYQASSATHGGGGVTGIPGLHATRQIMHDRRRTRSAVSDR